MSSSPPNSPDSGSHTDTSEKQPDPPRPDLPPEPPTGENQGTDLPKPLEIESLTVEDDDEAAGQSNSQNSGTEMPQTTVPDPADTLTDESTTNPAPMPGPELTQSATPGHAGKLSETPEASTGQSSPVPDVSANQSSALKTPEDAGEYSKASLARLESDDSMEITEVEPEFLDLTDEVPYNGHSLETDDGVTRQQQPAAVMSFPDSDAGVDVDSMKLDSTFRDVNALPKLEGVDPWQINTQGSTDETEDAMMMIEAVANNFWGSSAPNSAPTIEGTAIPSDFRMTDSTTLDSEIEDAEAAANFANLKMFYMKKKNREGMDEIDEIEYSKACRAEEQRKRLRARRQARLTESQVDDESMFLSDDDRRSPSPALEAEDEELVAQMRGDTPNRMLGQATSKGKGKNGRSKGPKPTSKGGIRKTKPAKPKTTSKRGQKPKTLNFESIFSNDLISNAQRNQEKADQPGFTTKNKEKALKELISSMPPDQQKLHNVDAAELLRASKTFDGHGVVKADGAGGWKLKGMKSSLLHYQLLGTAFMREREGSQTRPYGGLVSDDMGLGKTVMAIANIVDGRADPKSKVKATLVVAPSSLVNQWMNEISTHADISKFGRVLQYRSGSRGISADPVADFSDSFVVITSYSEVVRSWPKKDPPPELCTERAISEWWEQQRSTKIGVLHKVTWRRVVIDEAHLIKNHLSRTSEAVCQLKGKFRWALSGTPVQNKIEEFFAFFHFLQIPHTGTYELFRKNFCKKDSHLSLGRLQQVLSRFMLRRTHADELLGAPILKLPKLQSRTVTIEFNIIEKAIYRIVKERFVENIRAYVRTDSVEKKYQSIFVLLLRLRQLTAHCLLVQDTLTDLLNEADLQRLWTLTEEEINPENGRLIQGLTVALSTAPFGTPEGQQQFAANRPILSRFRKYLQDLKDGGDWRKIIDRTVCTYCHEPPTNPHITSCHHIYCLECLNAIGLDAAHNSDDRGSRCVECGVYFGGRVEACAREELTPDRGSPASVGSSTKKGAATKGEAMGTDWFTVTGPILQSAKTTAAVQQIERWFQEDDQQKDKKPSKVIIFTQFQAMIKVLARICQERKWGYESFHGKLSFEEKDQAIQTFSEDKNCFILLAGLKAGGVGLNLTAANRVIIIDLWWNQYVETQAFCRVYRIGQDREVDMVRIVVKDTVDEEILMMQEKKNLEIDKAVESKYRPGRLSTKELLQLFAVDLERDKNGDPLVGANEEPFIPTNDPHEQEVYSGDLSD